MSNYFLVKMASSMDATGALRVTAVGGASNVTVLNPSLTVDDGGTSITVDGSVSVSNFPAVQPIDDNGASITIDGTVAVSNFPASSGNSDGNGRQRVSNPHVVQRISARFRAPIAFYEGLQTGNGFAPSFNEDTKGMRPFSGSGAGTSTIVSRNYVPVESGCSYVFQLTFAITLTDATVTNRLGWYDPHATGCQNGFVLQVVNTTPSFVWYYNNTNGAGSNVTVAQASWNLDTLDGAGPSGYTLDLSSSNQQTVVFQVSSNMGGPIRFGFIFDDAPTWCHIIYRNNTSTRNRSMTIPLFCQVQTLAGTAIQATTEIYEGLALREGLSDPPARNVFSKSILNVTTAAAGTHILSFRPLTTIASQIVRAQMLPLALFLGTNTLNHTIRIMVGATFSVAPTWGAVNGNYSAYEFATGGTYSGAGTGYDVFTAAVSLGQTSNIDLSTMFKLANFVPITLDSAGAQNALQTLSIIAFPSGAASLSASFSWAEFE